MGDVSSYPQALPSEPLLDRPHNPFLGYSPNPQEVGSSRDSATPTAPISDTQGFPRRHPSVFLNNDHEAFEREGSTNDAHRAPQHSGAQLTNNMEQFPLGIVSNSRGSSERVNECNAGQNVVLTELESSMQMTHSVIRRRLKADEEQIGRQETLREEVGALKTTFEGGLGELKQQVESSRIAAQAVSNEAEALERRVWFQAFRLDDQRRWLERCFGSIMSQVRQGQRCGQLLWGCWANAPGNAECGRLKEAFRQHSELTTEAFKHEMRATQEDGIEIFKDILQKHIDNSVPASLRHGGPNPVVEGSGVPTRTLRDELDDMYVSDDDPDIQRNEWSGEPFVSPPPTPPGEQPQPSWDETGSLSWRILTPTAQANIVSSDTRDIIMLHGSRARTGAETPESPRSEGDPATNADGDDDLVEKESHPDRSDELAEKESHPDGNGELVEEESHPDGNDGLVEKQTHPDSHSQRHHAGLATMHQAVRERWYLDGPIAAVQATTFEGGRKSNTTKKENGGSVGFDVVLPVSSFRLGVCRKEAK
ncbi:hypothetical protein FA13DRAFT_1711848 [Coprinellus micaceus]|uniref:Uncharacterized protein n=1 Tax=Coprinellus micaceus TaxID=71717 RepID=A0A4Y7T3M4_COPMI|nr:hypothetical protein FA13DRAFT_1711848 [Coprinellus micaceus]